MSETKFTKRRMLWLNSATSEQFIVDADDPTQVVSRYPSVYDATERDQANADLDLAAPDMHNGCHQSVDRLSDLPRFLRENGYGAIADVVAEVLEVQSAALAKARGEAAL